MYWHQRKILRDGFSFKISTLYSANSMKRRFSFNQFCLLLYAIIWICVESLIPNPAFLGRSKEFRRWIWEFFRSWWVACSKKNCEMSSLKTFLVKDEGFDSIMYSAMICTLLLAQSNGTNSQITNSQIMNCNKTLLWSYPK